MAAYEPPKSMRELIAVPKGNTVHADGEAFLLHVFWEAPSMSAAIQLLEGLQKCAVATYRDTPCTPTYFFRVTNIDIAAPTPRKIGEHRHINEAKRKQKLGFPLPVILTDLTKRGIAHSLLDLDPEDELPAELQAQPICLEFTEIYLDEQAFMEHCGSRDYLEGYGVVMNPILLNSPPTTVRLGTPSNNLIEKILDPILKERVMPLPRDCFVWRPLPIAGSCIPAFFSLDISLPADAVSESPLLISPPSGPLEQLGCTSFVAFKHPLRPDTARIMFVLAHPDVEKDGNSGIISSALLEVFTALSPILRGEIHVQGMPNQSPEPTAEKNAAIEILSAAARSAGLDSVIYINKTVCSGYSLHELASNLCVKPTFV